jgi:peptidyl-prolyl cis-trans isomerase D
MAIIGKIRKRSGLLVIIIGIALAIFVFQSFDPFSLKRKGRGGSSEFAKIGDEKVAKQDFDAKVAEQEDGYKKQAKKENLTSAEAFQVMTSAWDQMERSIIMLKEYEELGLALEHDKSPKPGISPEELYDLIAGQFLHPYIVQNFADPKTGQVNRQQIQSILQKFDELKEEDKIQWKRLEDGIKEDRINTKYNTLIAQGYYMPKTFAKRMYEESNRTANLRCVGVKYQTIGDSTITLTDADYQKYYDEHSYEYQQEPSCDIDYVVWDVLPSKEDKKKVDDEVALFYEEFKNPEIKDIELFVNAHSDEMYDSTFKKKGTLPVQMDSIMFNSPIGTTVAPYLENNTYYMSRLVQVQMRPDSMRASHILVMFKDAPGLQQQANVTRTKEQARALADSLLNVLKGNPGYFAPLALTKSEFPSAKQDTGNLKWFGDGDPNMKFFYDSCMNMKVGEMKVILSNLGYHVLYLTGKLDPVRKVKVAMVKREIKPSTQTFNFYFSQASEFAGANRTKEAFNQAVTAKGLNKRSAQYVRAMDFSLPGLETSREIIRWAYNEETEKGAVSSQVFDAQGKYVVAVLLERREKGVASLEQVKTYIEPLIKRGKKAETITKNLNTALASSKDLYQLANKFTTGMVDTMTAINFASYNLPKYGPEPKVVGKVFTLKPNVLSAPIEGDMAVYLVQIDQIQEPPANGNYMMQEQQMAQFFRQRVQNDVFRSLKDKTKIVDNRILYY